MQLIVNPLKKHLDAIKTWLKEEDELHGSGFYCNWSVIENAHRKNCLLALFTDNCVIGFICWTAHRQPYVDLDIMEMHPRYRHNGYGKQFVELAQNYFRSHKFIAITLFCSPMESESFWRKLNFIKYPDNDFNNTQIRYYKPLSNFNKTVAQAPEDKLELWNLEPYEIKNQEANWTWAISKDTPPVIAPANGDWNLRLTKGGLIIKDDKVKYFEFEKDILVGPFLHLDTSVQF